MKDILIVENARMVTCMIKQMMHVPNCYSFKQSDSCDIGYKGGICSECVAGHYSDENNDCISCNTNCLSCANSSACNVCKKGYDEKQNCNECSKVYYKEKSTDTIRCIYCSDECMKCLSANQCAQCKPGYEGHDCSLCNEDCELIKGECVLNISLRNCIDV